MDQPKEKSIASRRNFLRALPPFLAGIFGYLFKGSAWAIPDHRNNKNIPKNYIQNRDTPGFHIRSANPFLGVEVKDWGLAIGGLVKKSQALSYENLFEFKTTKQVSRLKCVECWSAKAEWEGFTFEEIVKRVQPLPEAKYVYFQSADSYYESYPLEELLRPRVLMVIKMNGQALSKSHGFPLRLIAPFKYGYKNIKYITRIDFRKDRSRNYWADNGPYSIDGTIQPGIDHPLDFKKNPLTINGGEVFHFFDKPPS